MSYFMSYNCRLKTPRTYETFIMEKIGALVGYARVSTSGQKLDIQLAKLKEFGCYNEHIFTDKHTGTTAQRPQLQECLKFLRKGDILVITKLDRLARSTLHLHEIANKLNEKEVGFKVLDQSIDTTTKEGRLLFSMLAAIAEFETELRKERQLEGIAKAKENNVRFGAKPKLAEPQINELKARRERGVLIKELMGEYNLSKSSIYRLLSSTI